MDYVCGIKIPMINGVSRLKYNYAVKYNTNPFEVSIQFLKVNLRHLHEISISKKFSDGNWCVPVEYGVLVSVRTALGVVTYTLEELVSNSVKAVGLVYRDFELRVTVFDNFKVSLFQSVGNGCRLNRFSVLTSSPLFDSCGMYKLPQFDLTLKTSSPQEHVSIVSPASQKANSSVFEMYERGFFDLFDFLLSDDAKFYSFYTVADGRFLVARCFGDIYLRFPVSKEFKGCLAKAALLRR